MLLALADRPVNEGKSKHLVSPGHTSTAAATAAVTAVSSMTTAATVTGHLCEAGINLLLGLLQHVDEIPGLLVICNTRVSIKERGAGDGPCVSIHLLSVVKKVMAVPFAPARPVRPMRWI